jgi:RNA polymerase sigma-70 factor (ECF subfamily)
MAASMTTQEPTHRLIDRARTGDRAALGELTGRFRPRLAALVAARLRAHGLPPGEAEDALQETLLRGVQTIERFTWQGEDSWLRWLGSIAEHVIVDLARDRQRRRQEPLADAAVARDPSPSRAARRDERFDRLQAALGCLTPDQRAVIQLVRLQKLPVQEVARRMDRSPDAVSQLLMRAARRLKELLAETESCHLPPRSLDAEGGADGQR